MFVCVVALRPFNLQSSHKHGKRRSRVRVSPSRENQSHQGGPQLREGNLLQAHDTSPCGFQFRRQAASASLAGSR